MGHRVRIYPHNDLFNLAHYHREVIEKKVAEGVEDALALDCMSCLIALAFTVEAIVNFVGSKRVPDWKERSSYKDKMRTLGSQLGFTFDANVEPYKTLAMLKELRDQMAHGKPIETTAKVSSKVALRRAMAAPWDNALTTENAIQAYQQVKSFEHTLLGLASISPGETLTSSFGPWSET